MATNPRPVKDSTWVIVETPPPPATLVGKPPVPLKPGKVPFPKGMLPVLVKLNSVLVNEKVVITRVAPVVPPKPARTAGSLYAIRSSPTSTNTVLTIRSFRSKSFRSAHGFCKYIASFQDSTQIIAKSFQDGMTTQSAVSREVAGYYGQSRQSADDNGR